MRTFFGDRCGHGTRVLTLAVLLPLSLGVVGAVVMLLWNWLMPAVFVGVKPVDYWQALGLLLLSKILFGGRPFHGKARRHWDGMTAEERDQLKRHFKSRWGSRFDTETGDTSRDAGDRNSRQ